MKEVFVLHGGDCYATREAYLEALRLWRVELADGQNKDWKARLGASLGSEYNVTTPRFPNSNNATYEEWVLMFEKYLAILPEHSILVGHSLGASFFAKYLSEHSIATKFRAVLLVAPAFDMDGDPNFSEFSVPTALEKLREQTEEIHIFHSEDDIVVPISELGKFEAALPGAVIHKFSDRGHFNQETFPELTTLILSL